MTEPTLPTGYDVLPAGSPPRSRSWAPAASAAAVLVVVAAALCLVVGRPGGSGALVDAATLVHSASAKATQAKSSDITLSMTIKVSGHTITATGGGSFDYRRRLGQMHMDMGGFGELQEVITPTAMYMRMPNSMNGAMGTATKPWLMIRYSDFKRYGVDYAKLMNQNSGSDPSSFLRMLGTASQIHSAGTATIDGVRTSKYTGSGSFADLVRAEGLGTTVDLSKLPAGTADTALKFAVWLDKEGLPRRMQMAMSGGVFAGGSIDMTMDFLHYGTGVSVTVPPSSLVTDMGGLLAQTGG